MIVAHDLDISNLTIGSTNSYNTASLLLGNLIKYSNDGDTSYIRPNKISVNRIFDYYGVDFRYMQTIEYSPDIDYILSSYQSVATQTTLTTVLAKYNKRTEEWTNCGRIFTTPATGSTGTRNTTAIDGKLYRYTSGSVEVNGISVTGSATQWETNRIFQGSRIGFGTTSSAEVTNWYEIATVPTETNFELATAAITNYAPGTPYVIEEMKIAFGFIGNGLLSGTILIHGVHEGVFSQTGTTVLPYGNVAGTGSFVDRQRGFVRLAEQQNSRYISIGPVVFNKSLNLTSSVNDYLYAYNHSGGNGIELIRYNMGQPITTISTGSSFNQFDFSTQSGSNVTSTLPVAPGRYAFFAQPEHGPGSGSRDIYFVGTGRLFRTKLSTIFSGSANIATDNWFEIPPMGPNNFAVFNSTNVTYIPTIDRFITTAAASCGVFKYNINGNEEIERRILLNSSTFNTLLTRPYPNFIYTNYGLTPIITCVNNTLYVSIGGASTQNIMFNIPIAADYQYAQKTKQWAVFPKLITNNNKQFKRALVKFDNNVAPENLGFPPERVFIYYRTTGIDDDSGEWTRLEKGGDMSKVAVTEQIQLAVAWDVLGSFALYPPVYGVTLVYENDSQISQYTPSISLTNVTNRVFAWRQAQTFTSTNIPPLRIRLYNSETGNLVLEDTTLAQSQGVFEYSSDTGSTWNPWDDTQNVANNYIKYTAISLPANTLINAVITEA
jgi:hypothetical protein